MGSNRIFLRYLDGGDRDWRAVKKILSAAAETGAADAAARGKVFYPLTSRNILAAGKFVSIMSPYNSFRADTFISVIGTDFAGSFHFPKYLVRWLKQWERDICLSYTVGDPRFTTFLGKRFDCRYVLHSGDSGVDITKYTAHETEAVCKKLSSDLTLSIDITGTRTSSIIALDERIRHVIRTAAAVVFNYRMTPENAGWCR